MESSIYDPLDKRNLGESVANALLRQARLPLGKLDQFVGAGIYALYYQGAFPAYARIQVKPDKHEIPICVGKAIPAGARKGGLGLGEDPGRILWRRLNEHRSSIISADNLDINDFSCRFLIVDDIWIPLGEALMITRFSPVWNNLVDGFGNHDPGKGRYAGLRPRWDTLHPGRDWAAKLRARTETSEQIIQEITAYLRVST